MKKGILLGIILLLFIVAIFVLDISLAENEGNEIKLFKGKNYLDINKSLLASELIALNPDIEYVSFFDSFLNKSIGYVNYFGGIGENFFIEPGNEYEISVDKDTVLILYEAP